MQQSYSTTSIQPSHLRRYQGGKRVELIKKINNPSMTTHAPTLVNVLAVPQRGNPPPTQKEIRLSFCCRWRWPDGVGVERFHGVAVWHAPRHWGHSLVRVWVQRVEINKKWRCLRGRTRSWENPVGVCEKSRESIVRVSKKQSFLAPGAGETMHRGSAYCLKDGRQY